MRKKDSWLTAALIIVWLIMLGLVAAFRWQARLDYDPVIVQGLAPRPVTAAEGLNLHDGRAVEREVTTPPGPVTQVGIGIANLRNTNPDAVIAVAVQDEFGAEMAKGFFTLGAARQDDLTYLPMKFDVARDEVLTLRIYSSGIPAGQDASLWFEPENGGIRFSILRRPTAWALWRSLI